jgi:hypothetical protein
MTNRLALVAVLLPLAFSLPHCGSTSTPAAPKLVAPTTISRQANSQDDRWSPHETICRLLEGNRVTITYGRPFREDHLTGERRPIWGGGANALVPVDKVWRLGADEATLLVTQKAIEMGGVTLPAGPYTLFLMLKADGSAQLLVNKEIGQWGSDPYRFDREFARIPLQRDTLPQSVDQFTIALAPAATRGGVLKIMWDNLQFSAPYVVQESPAAKAASMPLRTASDRPAR